MQREALNAATRKLTTRDLDFISTRVLYLLHASSSCNKTKKNSLLSPLHASKQASTYIKIKPPLMGKN